MPVEVKTAIESWFCKIDAGERARNDAAARYGYDRALLEYKGAYDQAMPSFVRWAKLVPINEVFSFVKTFIPTVYSRNPHIAFNAKGAPHIGKSKLLEMAVNAYWRELRLKQQVRRCIFDAIFAEGWMKLGYTLALGSTKTEEKDGQPLEENEFIRDEEVFATRVSWRHMVRDPNAVDGLHDARWVAQKITKPLAAVRDSAFYTAKDIRPTTVYDPKALPTVGGKNKSMSKYQQREEYVDIWEIWDKDTRKVCWISEGCDGYLRDSLDWPYNFDGFPFELLRFCDIDDEPYAPNLIASWEPQLWEKIKIRSIQMDHLKRFNRQLWAKQGSVSKSEMQKFAEGRTGAINFYEGDQPPQPAQYPNIQTDIYAIENRVDMDKDNISGQPNVVRSAPQKTQSRTLGELDKLVAGFQVRQSDPQGLVEDFCSEIAMKLAAVIMDYMPGDKFVRVANTDIETVKALVGSEKFDGTGFRFTKGDIEGAEFDVDVKVGSTIPLDKQGRLDILSTLLKSAQFLGIQPGSELAGVIGKNFFAELDIKEIEVAYDRMLKQMQTQRTVAQAQQIAQQALIQSRIREVRGQMAEEGSPESATAAMGMPPAPGGGVPGGL